MKLQGIILLLFLIGMLTQTLRAQEGYNDEPGIDYSKCDNCLVFPEKFMKVEKEELIDFSQVSPERQMDFLIGEWQLHYPEEQSPGFEIFEWFVKGNVIEGFQDWAIHPDHYGKIPWRAKSFFRYIKDEKRWQFQWIATSSYSIFSGKLENQNTFVFHENTFKGGPYKLKFDYPAKYVFKNITKDSFVVEWYLSEDNGETYPFLNWRLFYKRRT